MRDIKFRGKRVDNNEWVYGFLVIDTKGKYRIYQPAFEGAESMTYYFVIPESVGQFTGLKDKAGKEIYVGDILQCYVNDTKIGAIERVEFKNGCFVLRYRNISIYEWTIMVEENDHTVEVIGNIYENPELLNY